MKITVLRKMKYEGRFIYVMQFGETFQYLFAEDKDIYQNHITFKPHPLRKLLFKLNLRPSPYSPYELQEGEKVILSGAMETIDKIRDPNFKKDDPESRQREEAQAHAHEQGEDKCMWQTRQAKDGSFYYMCIRHGEAVKMEKGVAPKHN